MKTEIEAIQWLRLDANPKELRAMCHGGWRKNQSAATTKALRCVTRSMNPERETGRLHFPSIMMETSDQQLQ